VRLWDAGGSCLASIEHPGCVWAVAFTAAGDLVSGCSDAVGRVWSASAERQVRGSRALQLRRKLKYWGGSLVGT
jgi:phospholipase A-2-activating protein